jgi:hypothetical protein
MADDEPIVESILEEARQAGLPLTEEEAAELVKGVARMREMGRTVRGFLDQTMEPAAVFRVRQERSS